MRDRNIVAFEIKWPWGKKIISPSGEYAWTYREPIIVIWHVHPKTHDCGWTYPTFTKTEQEKIKKAFEQNWNTFFVTTEDGLQAIMHHVYTVYGIAELLLWCVWKKQVSSRYLPALLSTVSNPYDNLRRSLEAQLEMRDVESLFFCIARILKKINRKWWQHPRFHFWHWEIQVHPIQHLKRWLFSRCAKCGGRFKWKESPLSLTWDGEGPRWFRGEKKIVHFECSELVANSKASDV